VTTRLEDLGEADLAIEAATERLEVKASLFRRLDGILPGGAVLASNGSLTVVTRNQRIELRPETDGSTTVVDVIPVDLVVNAILAAAACLAAWSEPTFAESAKGGACVPSAYRVILDVGHTAAVPGAPVQA